MSDHPRTLSVERYGPALKARWDAFLTTAKNATFLFCRDYMDYHRDRFADHSLIIFEGDEVAGLLPANLAADGSLVSHEGLTYGGLVVSHAATLIDVLACFHAALRWLYEHHLSQLLYKRIPTFYNTLPDDEAAYALFLLEAQLRRRDCALVVNLQHRLPLRKGRKSEISKSRRFGVRVEQEKDFSPFWERVLVPRLADRYGVKPVHSLEEIKLLAARFPQNIKQFSAYCGDDIVAGATIYETPEVAHAQYSALTEEGRKMGALDYLFSQLIDDYYKHKRFFDFGIANENQGRTLNQGLLDWKEGFGGRCYAHDFYLISTASYVKLEPVLLHRLSELQQTAAPERAALSGVSSGA
ncbi:conserved hypothetical protein [Verrucomicrobia bacterium]|nr:conserved hypothetical protein [Verrucomicrobiota bacterium]